MQDIFCKVQQSGTSLEDYVMGQVVPGIKIGLGGPFVIDEALRKQFIKDDPGCKSLIRPFVAGTGITRYQTPKNPKYLIFIPKGWTNDPSFIHFSSMALVQEMASVNRPTYEIVL